MSSPFPETPSWRERLRVRQRMNRLMEKHPRLHAVLKGDLLWGIIFAAFIVILLVPLEGIRRSEYSINSVANETIIAPQDLRIPDTTSTEHKRQERLNALKSVYLFDDTQWRDYVNRLDLLFDSGRGLIAAELGIEIDAQPSRDQIAALMNDADFLLRLQGVLVEAAKLNVPGDVLRSFMQAGFSERLQGIMSSVTENVLKQPIVNTTLYPPYAAGYELRPREDVSKSSYSILSLSLARSQMQRVAAENLRQISGGAAIADWMQTLVEPTATLDEKEMKRLRSEALAVETLYFDIKRGEVIVRAGDRITDADTLAKINFIINARFTGLNFAFRLTSLVFFVSLFFYTLHKFSVWHKRRRKIYFHLFLLLCLTLAVNLAAIRLVMEIGDSFAATILQNVQDYYWAAPFAIGSMLIALLVGPQIAALYSIILVFLSGFLFNGNFTILLYSLIGCFVSIYGLRQYKERTALIKSGIALGLMNVITILALNLFNDRISSTEETLFILAMGLVSGLLSSFVVSFVLPVLESMFKIVTDIKLLELSNHEHPLLRSLFLNAPGTFQHSIVVGYLAEAAATEIGANPLFCRVACLYHDIGKVYKSHYFVENTDDLGRKHDTLSPHMSALIIANHVKEGIELGRKFRLPESIIEIIPQHHGTKMIRYFYEKARSAQKPGDVPVKEDEFRYPGPKPQTREAGIIMIADGVEATVRSLDEPSVSRIKGAIKGIIDSTFLDGQLDECDLTLKDLTKISDAFLRILLTMKHERIKYPEPSTGEKERSPEGEAEHKTTRRGRNGGKKNGPQNQTRETSPSEPADAVKENHEPTDQKTQN